MKAFRIAKTKRYDVTLAQPASVAGVKLLPRDKHELAGDLLQEIVEANGWEAIDDATPIS